MSISATQDSDEEMWPTWYTVQVWNAPDDLFMRTSYYSRETAVLVAQNMKNYYEDRMHDVTLRRWNYEPNEWELTGGEVEPGFISDRADGS